MQERADKISNILGDEPIFQEAYHAIHVCCNSKENILIPSTFYSQALAEGLFSLQYGYVNDATLKQVNVPALDAVLAYNSENIHLAEWMQKFPLSIVHHSSALWLKNKFPEACTIDCFFSDRFIKIIFFTNNNLQLLQTFAYETPADAAYQLLNACRQFKIDADEVQLRLYGLIDKDSSLYQEIYRYFLNIDFAQDISPVTVSENLAEVPVHFFSGLIKLAQCV